MATIKTVAERAGVSTATVSHVINGTRTVSEVTARNVMQAMAELGYVPSAFGRGLRKNTLKTLGFVAADMTNPYFAQVFRGVETVALERHYNVIVTHSDEDPDKELRAISNLIARGVDGVLFAPAATTAEMAAEYRKIPVPVVTFDRIAPEGTFPAVVADSRAAMFDAVRRLRAHGHQAIAFVSSKPGLSTSADRWEGYTAAIHPLPPFVFQGNARYDGGERAAHWISSFKPRPTAVVISNNLMAMGFVATLLEHFPTVMQTIEVVAMDDEPWTTFVRPPLSVIAQPTDQIGRQAAGMLADLISGQTVDQLKILPCRFIPRNPELAGGHPGDPGQTSAGNTPPQ
ncbi:MAG: LacI family DNA-binding transcriptional regulator [Thermaerobacter sp.]|nr:LacI family DNA-binding transcriptional regulator [Thermaerobacter sp.]